MQKPALLLLCVFMLGATMAATNLNGAGATFPYPVYSKWFSEFKKAHPDAEINYQSIGSGGGIRQLSQGTVDFGASDGPMTDKQLSEAKRKIYHVPTVLGAVVPAFNLPGIKDVKLTGPILADIFLGKVMNWNDGNIAKANPGVKLPNKPILVIHRSDGSGTTFIFTDYLSKVSKAWEGTVGRNTAVKWPVGLGAKGNEGVAGLIRQMDGAIGYIELVYAVQNNIAFAAVQNAEGNFVKASMESTMAAASASLKTLPADFRVSITNAPGKDAYPITSFTWLLIPAQWSDASKRTTMVTFLNWMLDSGESMVKSLNFAPLPKEVSDKVRATIQQIK